MVMYYEPIDRHGNIVSAEDSEALELSLNPYPYWWYKGICI